MNRRYWNWVTHREVPRFVKSPSIGLAQKFDPGMPRVATPAVFEFIGAHEQALFYKIPNDYFFHKDFGCKFGRSCRFAAGNAARIKSTILSLLGSN
jgi:hypothetical protein